MKIPSSLVWERVKPALIAAGKRILPKPARRRLADGYEWGLVLLNYALMRSSLVGRLFNVGVWPNTLYMEGTNICNAKCVFCAYPQMQRPKVTMEMDTFKNTILGFVRAGGREVNLSAIVGDPLIDRYLFDKLDFLRSQPQIRAAQFFTNAIAMRPAMADKLLTYGKFLKVCISFGGFDRETYLRIFKVDKFETVVPQIQHLIAQKEATGSSLDITVNLRVPVENRKGPFWDYLRDRHRKGIILLDWVDQFDNWGGDISEETLLAADLTPRPLPLKRGPCHRLLTGPAVLADGRVNACACRDVEATLIIGDLKTQSMQAILSGAPLKELLDKHERADFPAICEKCTLYESIYPDWMRGNSWKFFQAVIGGFGYFRSPAPSAAAAEAAAAANGNRGAVASGVARSADGEAAHR
ncbi:MAG: radical SAM protein [Elusimicrobia bacterium]|nr:radical SAM protein [Elusimicrobiota bacterium]